MSQDKRVEEKKSMFNVKITNKYENPPNYLSLAINNFEKQTEPSVPKSQKDILKQQLLHMNEKTYDGMKLFFMDVPQQLT